MGGGEATEAAEAGAACGKQRRAQASPSCSSAAASSAQASASAAHQVGLAADVYSMGCVPLQAPTSRLPAARARSFDGRLARPHAATTHPLSHTALMWRRSRLPVPGPNAAFRLLARVLDVAVSRDPPMDWIGRVELGLRAHEFDVLFPTCRTSVSIARSKVVFDRRRHGKAGSAAQAGDNVAKAGTGPRARAGSSEAGDPAGRRRADSRVKERGLSGLGSGAGLPSTSRWGKDEGRG
ncbi:hypothetical protein BS78_06G202200 [Paspalum vaginatum]|nr:hypothetical protein BS78_06G202200 [Paspalum vaginatum]